MRVFALLIFLMLPQLLVRDGGSMPKELDSASLQEMYGIDVSHYQDSINWDTLAVNPKVNFAFVKATEGADYVDSLYLKNWNGLNRNGIRKGAYHFFRAYGCGYDQALHFLQNVDLQPGDMAPVLDVEVIDGMPREVLLEEMRVWLQTVERCLHVKPIIYTNQHFYEQHLAGVFENNPLWIARCSQDEPRLSTGKQWSFWQFSHKGRLKGIQGDVDMNLFRGNSQMLKALCLPVPEETEQVRAIAAP